MIANLCLVVQYRLNYRELVPSNPRFPDRGIKYLKKMTIFITITKILELTVTSYFDAYASGKLNSLVSGIQHHCDI